MDAETPPPEDGAARPEAAVTPSDDPLRHMALALAHCRTAGDVRRLIQAAAAYREAMWPRRRKAGRRPAAGRPRPAKPRAVSAATSPAATPLPRGAPAPAARPEPRQIIPDIVPDRRAPPPRPAPPTPPPATLRDAVRALTERGYLVTAGDDGFAIDGARCDAAAVMAAAVRAMIGPPKPRRDRTWKTRLDGAIGARGNGGQRPRGDTWSGLP